MKKEIVELYVRVHGRVQGVMFRDFVRTVASSFGLAGYVHNCDDGSVELVAQGNKEDLDALIPLLARGPDRARVERVDAQWRRTRERRQKFEIV